MGFDGLGGNFADEQRIYIVTQSDQADIRSITLVAGAGMGDLN
jgi:hypothetical protein